MKNNKIVASSSAMVQRDGDRPSNRSFFPVIPACVTISVLVAGPAAAATLSLAETTLTFENFSHVPTRVFSVTDTWTYTIARDGRVSAIAQANASFSEPDISSEKVSSSIARHATSVLIQGEGRDYYGFGRSIATTLGQNFTIGAEESFSFDFTSTVKLLVSNAAQGNPNGAGKATSSGEMVLHLYEQTEFDEWSLLEAFGVLNSLSGRNNSERFTFAATEHILFKDQPIDWIYGNPDAPIDEETAFSSVTQGRLVRTFQKPTQLMLVGYTHAEGMVGVPEPSTVGALIFLGLVSFCWRRRIVE